MLASKQRFILNYGYVWLASSTKENTQNITVTIQAYPTHTLPEKQPSSVF